jgi:hypothetical protein
LPLGDLFGDDGHKSYRALCALSGAPKEVLPALRARLKPAPGTERERLARLVKDLDADEFDAREKATAELGKLGAAAEGALRQALEGRPSAEVKQRINSLLEKLTTTPVSAEQARESRALELLERLETAEARDFLKELAKGGEGARLTEEAKAAVRRQATRAPANP